MTIRGEKIVTVLAVLGVLVGFAQAREKTTAQITKWGRSHPRELSAMAAMLTARAGAVRLTAQRITSTTLARRMGSMRLKPPRQWQALCLLG